MPEQEELAALQYCVDASARSVVADGPTKARISCAVASELGTRALYQSLEGHLLSPGFAEEFCRHRGEAPLVAAHGVQVSTREWWTAAPLPVPASVADPAEGYVRVESSEGEAEVSEDTGSFVVVHDEDALEAMAAFIAAVMASLPETRDMQPQELQRALKGALRELRKSPVRRLLDAAKTLYRVSALSYGAFTVYENPLSRALLGAVWSVTRLLLGLR